jgi:hypothetical protein
MASLAAALWSRELRNTEAFSIDTRSQAGRAFEQAAEERGIFVADAPADPRFSAAAQENGLSRIYAGIHFRHAVTGGGVRAAAWAEPWLRHASRFAERSARTCKGLSRDAVAGRNKMGRSATSTR